MQSVTASNALVRSLLVTILEYEDDKGTKMEKTDSKRGAYRDRNPSSSITTTTSKSFLLHSICALGLAIAFWVSQNVYSINLISDPIQTLRLIWVVESPILILLYSFLRRNPEKCSFLKAVGRGFIGLITGAVLMAFGAVILGAPIGIQYLTKTVHWSLLMSLFTFVPAACVFGSSWIDWQRLFANTRPVGTIDYMICIPAHGAVIGAWLGAWPMPLDWERPWQEWPVCVSYGAVAGYLVGIVASLGFVLVLGERRHHVKGE